MSLKITASFVFALFILVIGGIEGQGYGGVKQQVMCATGPPPPQEDSENIPENSALNAEPISAPIYEDPSLQSSLPQSTPPNTPPPPPSQNKYPQEDEDTEPQAAEPLPQRGAPTIPPQKYEAKSPPPALEYPEPPPENADSNPDKEPLEYSNPPNPQVPADNPTPQQPRRSPPPPLQSSPFDLSPQPLDPYTNPQAPAYNPLPPQQSYPQQQQQPIRSPKVPQPPPPSPFDLSPQPTPSNRGIDNLPNNSEPSPLETLLADLNKKLKDLEKTQSQLNKHITDLEDKVKDLSKLIPEARSLAASSLTNGNPQEALNTWQNLQENLQQSPELLQNVTNDIVAEACEQNAMPQNIMNFVHNIPLQSVKPQAYDTLADKMYVSEPLQEQMYWQQMNPFLKNVAEDVGRLSPTMFKMNGLQQQMRLEGAQPVKRCSRAIAQNNMTPALNAWGEMSIDIRDRPDKLRSNMKKIVSKSYNGNAANAPLVLEFITRLPQSQDPFRQIAYNFLREEMAYN